MSDDPRNVPTDDVDQPDDVVTPDDVDQTDDVAVENSGAGYEPSYSEPHWDTSSKEEAPEIPTDVGIVAEEESEHATPPVTAPLTADAPDADPQSGQAQWWSTGAAPGGVTPGHSQPGTDVPPAPGQQPPWAGPPQGQQYQGGPPLGGMPPQGYTGGYAPMAAGSGNPNWLAGPTEQGRNTLTLDYWLSVFFSWIPALIFFLTERDKNRLVDEHTKELLNFNITRVVVGAVAVIPIVGWIVGGIASVVLFVLAVLGAIKGPDEYANGRTYQFPLAIRFIK